MNTLRDLDVGDFFITTEGVMFMVEYFTVSKLKGVNPKEGVIFDLNTGNSINLIMSKDYIFQKKITEFEYPEYFLWKLLNYQN